MQTSRYDLWAPGEYQYPAAFGFTPNITSYIHDEPEYEGRVLPCVVVVPGGAYRVVSPSEDGIVAERFYSLGYNAFVVTYTTNLLELAPLKLQPLCDLSRAVRFVRRNAGEFNIDADKLVTCGFSAGGHLVGSLCVHYGDVVDQDPAYQAFSNRPDAALLCYPVITSGEYAHKESFDVLLGVDATEEELAYMSLEKQVTPQTPPCFIWQTRTDEMVPVENSILMANALRAAGVPVEHHVFSHGQHGLSLADDVWASGDYGEPYTMEQMFGLVAAVKSGEVELPPEKQETYAMFTSFGSEDEGAAPMEFVPNEEVKVWPGLADAWIRRTLEV